MKLYTLLHNFSTPPNGYRPVPFWALNDLLEESELVCQIEKIKEGGWGGFFMHSREGLLTLYLSNEWMDAIRVCVNKAQQLGLDAWLYDEDKWPSGYAGGIVPKLGEKYRSKSLILDEVKLENQFDDCDVLCYLNTSSVTISLITRKDVPTALEEKSTVYAVYKHTMELGEALRYQRPNDTVDLNGTAYVDLLNKDVTQAFIDSTYEKYRKATGAFFGSIIPGVFTDEPAATSGRYGIGWKKTSIPWTDGLCEVFRTRRGYDLAENVASLFFETGDYKKVRYDYRRTLSEMFEENFTQFISEWCSQNGIKFTGHYMSEDTLASQVEWVIDVMPHYKYMHIPGIDNIVFYIDNPQYPKQVTSVARQYGKERCLSELFGVTGHNLSFEEMKRILDWHFVLGINLFTPHMALYSLRGRRKRDFPPVIFYQQPYWKDHHKIADYTSRLSYVLSQGKAEADTLVISPIESVWAETSPLDTKNADEISGAFQQFVKELLNNHVPYDIGNEHLIAEDGAVENGLFKIAGAGYRTVILPFMTTIRWSTAKLLEKFITDGGTAYCLGGKPTLVDGAPDSESELAKLFDKTTCFEKYDELVSILRETMPVTIKGKNASSVWFHHRKSDVDDIFFFVNLDTTRKVRAYLTFATESPLVELDPLTGGHRPFGKVTKSKNVYKGAVTFDAGQSLLLAAGKVEDAVHVAGADDAETKLRKGMKQKSKKIVFQKNWTLTRNDFNALTLDMCKYKTNEDMWSSKIYTLHLTEKLSSYMGPVELEYWFDIKDTPEKIFLVLENPEMMDITVNSTLLSSTSNRSWVDHSFKMLDIASLVKGGNNIVNVKFEKTPDFDIESAYIVGDFAVENRAHRRFSIIKEEPIDPQLDLTVHGYPFYAGTFTCENTLMVTGLKNKHYKLSFTHINFCIANVKVNGKEAGSIFCKPYELDITDFLKQGINTITIEITNTLVNILGPHHNKNIQREYYGITIDTFRAYDAWTDKYVLEKFSLDNPRIIVTEVM